MAKSPAVNALAGIRFFAVIHVVFYHYSPALPVLLENVVQNGYTAVGLFFILSGFVLTYNYGDKPLDIRRFWAARFSRIYPYLLAFLLIGPAVAIRWIPIDPARFVASGLAGVLLLQGWFLSIALVWNGPGWSLCAEVFFYLLFPLASILLSGLSQRGLHAACAVLSIVILIPPSIEWVLYGSRYEDFVTYIPMFRLAEFALGVAIGFLYLRSGHKVHRGAAGPLFVLGCLTAFAVWSPVFVPKVLRGALAAPLFASFIFWLASSDSFLAKFFSWNFIRQLGDASYSVYILQSPVFAFFLLASQGTRAAGAREATGWGGFVTDCLALIAASLACYRWVETPARRRLTILMESLRRQKP